MRHCIIAIAKFGPSTDARYKAFDFITRHWVEKPPITHVIELQHKTFAESVKEFSAPNQDVAIMIEISGKLEQLPNIKNSSTLIIYNDALYRRVTQHDIGKLASGSGLKRMIQNRLTLFLDERPSEEYKAVAELLQGQVI